METHKEVIGDCVLYLGDCIDVLPTINNIDAVVTDPPYGFEFNGKIGYSAGCMSDSRTLRDGNVFKEKGFGKLPVFRGMTLNQKTKLINFHEQWLSKCKGALVIAFSATKTMHLLLSASDRQGFEITDVGCWKYSTGMRKKRTLYQPQIEPFAILYGGKLRMNCDGVGGNVLSYEKPNKKNGHPTQKPLELMKELIRVVPSETIIDPFMGSGTTGVASIQMSRKFIGIERDPEYFDIACKRIYDFYKQGNLF